MIRLRYFASLRERLACEEEYMALDASRTVADVRARLRARGEVWASALGDEQPLLAAVNQELARPDTPLSDGDEVAFFPPVTGG